MNFLVFATLLITVFSCATGVKQYFTFFQGENCTGDYIGFTSKHATLTYWEPFINASKSAEYVGNWQLYREPNFTNIVAPFGPSYEPRCSPTTFAFLNVQSLRHQGPLDTATSALSVYEGPGFAGREVIITTLSANNFPFVPAAAISSGRSNWTLWETNNFTGNATCFENTSGSEADHWLIHSVPFASVVSGCTGA
ncbi:uncharacterized protein LOC110849704 [Folsomia candida]|uniref:Gamma-crystallin F n=1 Tax=Folsomia candida TaxID=158441 RepID=A0A226EC19_FOLCA|nr:uncharacterized protein LOC110849704 [Folsomia candida]OXA54311.1 Gamma-crystallin F [Folsomia candida]